jgi:hypothetical protein
LSSKKLTKKKKGESFPVIPNGDDPGFLIHRCFFPEFERFGSSATEYTSPCDGANLAGSLAGEPGRPGLFVCPSDFEIELIISGYPEDVERAKSPFAVS